MKISKPTLAAAIAVPLTSVNAAFTNTNQQSPCRSLACQMIHPVAGNSRVNMARRPTSSLNAARSIFQEIDEFFDDFASFPSSIFDPSFTLSSSRGMLPSRTRSGAALANSVPSMAALRRSSPRYDIVEHDNGFVVNLDMPGVRAADVKIDYKPATKVLHVSGGRKIQESGRTVETFFEKHFRLADNIDAKAVSANLVDGVLSVMLPKDPKYDEVTSIAVTENTVNESPMNAEIDVDIDMEGKEATVKNEDTENVSIEKDENTIEL